MKESFQLFLFSTVLGLLFISNPVYGQDPFAVNLEPVKGGFDPNTGTPRSPEEFFCPLSLYYKVQFKLQRYAKVSEKPNKFGFF